jgi:hypothetical protein
MKTTTITIRVTPFMRSQLEEIAVDNDTKISKVVKAAIAKEISASKSSAAK